MKKIIIAITGVLTILLLSGCNKTISLDENPDVTVIEKSLETLDNAKVIKMNKHAFSLSDYWDITVDNQEFGTIKGEFLPLLGDVYTLRDKENNILAYETEDIATFSNKAQIYDYNGVKTGLMTGKFWSLTKDFAITESNNKKPARLKADWTLVLKSSKIYNDKDQVQYDIQQNFSVFNKEWTITKKRDGSVTGKNAVLLTAILNETTENHSGGHSSKK